MNKKPETYKVDLECPYGKAITLRRSGMSPKAWEYICYKFTLHKLFHRRRNFRNKKLYTRSKLRHHQKYHKRYN